MDKGCEASNLLIRKIEVWHALLRASVADDFPELVSIHILGDQLRALEIRPTHSTARGPTMTKCTILLKEGVSLLDQSQRVGFACGSVALPGSLRSSCAAGGCLCCGNGKADEQGSRQPYT